MDGSNRAQACEYGYSEAANTFGLVALVLSEGIAFGMKVLFPSLPLLLLAGLPILLFLPAILYREEACVDLETGEFTAERGIWPWVRRRRYAKGELRRVILTGESNPVYSLVAIWAEDRAGQRYRLCTEGPEQIEDLHLEAYEVAEALGVPLDVAPRYYDARRRIHSQRRARWRAGLEMTALGALTLLLNGLVYAAALGANVPAASAIREWHAFPIAPEVNLGAPVQLAALFLGCAFLITGIPLCLENRDRWKRPGGGSKAIS